MALPLILATVLASFSLGADLDLPELRKATFDDGGVAGWKMTDPAAWKIVDHAGGKALELVTQSKYQPKVRSPINYALIEDLAVTDFRLDVDVKSTCRDYGHRDLCLFFGYQGPEQFYYVHLGKKADPHAHSVFLVNQAPRVSIAKERTAGTPWTDGVHHVRITRDSASGDIKVYFDDMTKPVMQAVDKSFTWGKVGVGSFDDTGLFDNLVLRGRRHTP